MMGKESPPLPRLSPSQRAYREDLQGFLGRLEERAQSLFESGYKVEIGQEKHCFTVITPPDKHGLVARYRVNALTKSCSCPFYARQALAAALRNESEYLTPDGSILPCKHILGLPTLVRKTRLALADAGQVREFCSLSCHWLRTLSVLRQERIQEERAQERTRHIHERKEEDGINSSIAP